ncbi:MAG: IS21-like element helper ATPase IstB [Acidimicrobiales bacterium]
MLVNTTIERLRELRLDAMAQGVVEQREQPDYASLSFEDRLGLLVDRELLARSNRRLTRLLRAAHLKLPAVIEDLDFARPRGLDRKAVLGLAESHWVNEHQVVIVVGPTGVGKTYLACALAHAAIRRGHTALYLRAPRMFDELALARADGRLSRLMASWARIDVLVIDDFLIRPLTPEQAADLLEVIEDRAQLHSTIVTSQLPVANWHEALGDATIADAVLDRLLERANRIELTGDSMRRGDNPRAPKATSTR